MGERRSKGGRGKEGERQSGGETVRKESVTLRMRGRKKMGRKTVEGGRGKGGTRDKLMLNAPAELREVIMWIFLSLQMHRQGQLPVH